MRGAAASLLIPFGGSHKAGAQTAVRLHALAIGINTYTGRVGSQKLGPASFRKIPPLLGCVNDAQAITAAIRPVAQSVEMLLDQQVSRSAFMAAWHRLVARSQPGDVLLFSYSGHGGQERGAISDRAPDGLYDTFIMPSLDTSDTKLSEERILADEMQTLLASVADRNKVIFVADACHAGGMAREPSAQVARDIRYRTIFKYNIDSELRAPISNSASGAQLSLPHVMFLSGADHGELVPELIIDGKPHGALSVAFASGVSGLADEDGDGTISGLELSSYVLKTLRTLSNSSQHPNVRWPRSDVRSGSDLLPGTPLVASLQSSSKPERRSTPPAVLKLINVADPDAAEIGRVLSNATIAVQNEMADIYWDSATQVIADGLGSVIAYDIKVSELQGAVNAAILTKSLQYRALQAPLPMRIQLPDEPVTASVSKRSDHVHREGTTLGLVVEALKNRNFVAFNVAGNGEIQLLFPVGSEKPVLSDLDPVSWSLKVRGPFGADHVVAINSDASLDDLLSLLRLINGEKEAAVVTAFFQKTPETERYRIGVQGIFTSPRP